MEWTWKLGTALALCVGAILGFQYAIASAPRGADVRMLKGGARRDLHVRRKLQHAVTGVAIYAATAHFPAYVASVVLFTFSFAFWSIHQLRKTSARVDKAFLRSYYGILREDEVSKHALPGSFFFLLGSALAFFLFSPAVARLALLHLAVGDPAASFFGVTFGRHKVVRYVRGVSTHKSVEGSLGCFVVSSVASYIGIALERQFFAQEAASIALFSLLAGTGATLGEVVDLNCDDNLSLPLVSGLFLQAAPFLISTGLK